MYKVALFVLLAIAYTCAEEKPAAAAKPTTLSEAWDDIDNNNDNKASKEEVELYFEKVGLPKSLAEEAFKKADKNGDNTITKEEYEAWAKDEDAKKAAAPPKPY